MLRVGILLVAVAAACGAGAADAVAQSCPQQQAGAASLLFKRRVRWGDYATPLAAVELEHSLTALAVLPRLPPARRRGAAPPSSAGAYLVLGDAAGGLHFVSAGGAVVGRLHTGTPSPVTALAVYACRNASGVAASGHASGEVRVHSLRSTLDDAGVETLVAELVHAAAPHQVLCSAAGATCAGVVQLDAAPSKGGHRAVLAVLDAAGGVATARLDLRRLPPAFVVRRPAGEGGAEGGGGAVGMRAHASGVSVFTRNASVQWLPLRAGPSSTASKPRPERPCSGLGLGGGPVAAAVYDSALGSRAHAFTAGGRLATVLGALGTHPRCQSLSSAPLAAAPPPAAAGVASTPLAAASLPGFVLAVTSAGHILVANVTSMSPHSPPDVVLSAPLAELAAALGLAPPQTFPDGAFGGGGAPTSLQLAAADGADGSRVAGATALVAVQLGPRVAALYAAGLPRHGRPPPPGLRLAWLQMLQPFLIAGMVGVLVWGRGRRGADPGTARTLQQVHRMLGAQAGGQAAKRSPGGGTPPLGLIDMDGGWHEGGDAGAHARLNRLWNGGLSSGESSADEGSDADAAGGGGGGGGARISTPSAGPRPPRGEGHDAAAETEDGHDEAPVEESSAPLPLLETAL